VKKVTENDINQLPCRGKR